MTELETELLTALKAARTIIAVAARLDVGFDPAEFARNTAVQAIDAAIAKAEAPATADTRCSLCGQPWPFTGPCGWGGCPLGADL